METFQLPTSIENSQNASFREIGELAHHNFSFFYNFVWGFSIEIMEGAFKDGDHLDEWCDLFQHARLLSILSARKHSKSEVAHAYLAWRIFNMDYTYIEKWLYLSYTGDLAGEHLADTKERIKVNPFFIKEDIYDLTDAKTILHYRKGSRRFYCQPSGIESFKRGKHPDGVITDDILKDPEARLDLSQTAKITRIFMEQVMSLPKENGLGLKNIGTAQDKTDLFHVLEGKKSFVCKRYPAEKDTKDKITLWPEMFSWDRLQEIKDDEIGEKAYNKEYMCVPVRTAEGYFTDVEIDKRIYKRLINRNYHKAAILHENAVGGLDIGKKRHPSHLSIFGFDRRKRMVQLLSLWMDGVDYTDQVEICRQAIKSFGVFRLYYDDTRAEFESFKESGNLPGEMKGKCFTHKLKFEIAACLERRVKGDKIMLVNDRRQRNQIINCDNDLKSVETQEGHGDSFWSNALAAFAAENSGESIRFI